MDHAKKIKQMEEKLASYEDDSYLSLQEVDFIKEKLEEIEFELTSKIKELIEEGSERDNEIATLKREIESLKIQSKSLTKKNWLLAYSTKLYIWSHKHPKLAQLMGTIAYNVLPEGIRDSIPKNVTNIFLPNVNPDSVKSIGKIND